MSDMREQLPYTLTTGVTATREGLWIYNDYVVYLALTGLAAHGNPDFERFVSWPDAAKRLQYREGELWCHLSVNVLIDQETIDCAPSTHSPDPDGVPYLHRLAAILCDDAEAFRVLHWCIHNLPQETNNG